MQLKRALANEEEVLNIPIIMGGVGLGKTSIARYIADQLASSLIKINCGECGDPSEFGMPVPFRIVQDNDSEPYMPWVLNRALHIACTERVVLFFDDIDKAPALVEGALLSIFGERTVRDRKLHPETVVIAAGNRVEDDALARHLSESLRTRGTIINLSPNVQDFMRYAKDNPSRVHPALIGFLGFRPGYLHKHDADADRFPTPRGWVEASAHLYEQPEADWRTFIALKCGEPVSNEFDAWWSICSKIDVKKLLLTGEVEHRLSGDADTAIVDFAAVFAVAQELNAKGPKKEYVGLEKYLLELHAEHRAALLAQLSNRARSKIADLIPSAASLLASDIPLGD